MTTIVVKIMVMLISTQIIPAVVVYLIFAMTRHHRHHHGHIFSFGTFSLTSFDHHYLMWIHIISKITPQLSVLKIQYILSNNYDHCALSYLFIFRLDPVESLILGDGLPQCHLGLLTRTPGVFFSVDSTLAGVEYPTICWWRDGWFETNGMCRFESDKRTLESKILNNFGACN